MTLGISPYAHVDRRPRDPARRTEEALFHSYSNGTGADMPRILVEPCACGGRIEAHEGELAIRYALNLHQDSEQHRRWRTAMRL